MVDLSWTDNCDGAGTVTGTDVSDGLSCPETITRTWTYTDGCGNTATVSQTIVVDDTTPPTASNPVSISVPGALDVPLPDPLVVTNEADNCTLNPVVAWLSDLSDGNVCNLEEITRTYSVTDDCGNQILVTQIIVIEAVPAPIDAGPDQLVCSGDFVTLTAINPLGAILAWTPVPVQDNIPFQVAQTQTYTVTADYLGCLSSDDVTVVVEDLPEVSFNFEGSGCAPLTVTLTNTSTSPGALVDCIWDIEGGATLSGCGTVSYTFESGGLYDVTLTTTSANGCSNSATYTDLIYVEDVPIASFIASGIDLTNLMTEVHFENTSIGAVSYLWNFGDNTALSTQVNPIHVFPDDASGSYVIELIAYSPLGCTDTTWLVINISEELIYYVPNTFTPDGDDYNETFKPVFTAGYDPYDFTLLLFNRWGEIIWESHDVEVGWDGTYGGKLMPDGVYTWKIDFKTTESDERVMITGHVSIIR
jgi:gliding motility-associated-like protein